MEKEMEFNNKIDERIKKVVPEILKGSGYTDRKLGDTPTDNLSLVPRKYVNLNGATASRPIGSVTGQFYFDTTIGGPIWRRNDGAWVNGVSSVV